MLKVHHQAWKTFLSQLRGRRIADHSRRRLLGGPSDIASAVERLEERALLTDLTPPVVVSATPIDDPAAATFSHVKIVFDEAVATPSATNAQNYRLVNASGAYIAISAAAVDPNDPTGKTIILACTPQSAGVSYDVHVGGVADLAGNASPLIGRNYSQSATLISSPRAMTMGDFDKDGIADVVTASNNNKEVWFHKGISGGSFATPVLLITDATSVVRSHLTSADLDGDGNLDLISPASSVVDGIHVYFGNGDGTFGSSHFHSRIAAFKAAVADVDADGDLDIVVGAGLGFSTYLNPWNPYSDTPASQATVRSFESWTSVLTLSPIITVADVHVGDVNLDGRMDIVGLPQGVTIAQVWLGTGVAGVFLPALSLDVNPFDGINALADLTGDGRLDLVSGSLGGMFVGSPFQPFFASASSTGLQSGLQNVYAVDLDSDGDLDLIGGRYPQGSTNTDPTVYIAYNQGGGVFGTTTTISLAALGIKRVRMMGFRDMNGDGLVDIVGIDGSTATSNFFVLTSQIGASSANFVFSPNSAPTPSAGGPYVIAEGGSLSVTAAGSTDPNGDALTYLWDINNDGVFGDAAGVSPTLTWAQLVALGIDDSGSRSIAVLATDSRGWSVTGTAALTITNTAPTLAISGAATIAEGSTYVLTLSASGDPGNDTITSWVINWGDGTSSTVSGGPVAHIYADNGDYVITATATDEDGTYLAGNSVLVAVANVKPTATWNLVTSQTGTADITIEATPTDPGSNDVISYHWLVTRNGISTSYSTKSITFTPLAGLYSVVVVINDDAPGEGVTLSGTIKVRAFEDLFAYSSGSWTIGQSTSTAFNTIAGPTWGNLANAPVATGDFNGDGATDLLRLEGSKLHVAVASGTSFTDWGLIELGSGTYTNLTLGDVNGDGRTDVLTRLDGIWYVSISTGTGFAAKAGWGGWSTAATWVDIRLADLNGDGKSDLLGRTSGGNWYAAKANADGTAFETASLATIWQNLTWDMTATVDVNGDGKADLLGRTGTDWYVSVSDGSSLGTTTRWAAWSTAVTWVDHRVGDFNGDGKTDIIARNASNGNWFVAITNDAGSGFNGASVWGSWNATVTWQDARIGDFDGDGKADIAARLNGNWYVATAFAGGPTVTGFNAGKLWVTGWTSSYSFIGVGNVYAAGPAGAPVATYSPKASSGTSAVSGQAAIAASTQEGSLALFWSSTKDDDRFAAALLSSSRA